MDYAALRGRLEECGQQHLLTFWEELSDAQKEGFAAQLDAVRWEKSGEWVAEYVTGQPEQEIPADIQPPTYFAVKPENDEQVAEYAKALADGEKMIAEGKVALCTVAGGQGTRLGFDGPKGTYPVSPIKNKTLFQMFAEQVSRLQEKYDTEILWFVMTSIINNEQTQTFFEENSYFGLKEENVVFFVQGLMPCFDQAGKVLLADKDSMAMSPDGHGGTLLALQTSGALDRMKETGAEYISYFQIDNPLVPVIDPLFIGLHHLTGSEMSSRSLTKTGPYEKLGNFCVTGGKMMIIEYSDMPDDLAQQTDADGRLAYRAGSPAIHVISRKFVERLTAGGEFQLPFHRANKKVPYTTLEGTAVKPEENNAVKLETFIFDALPLANNPLILEAVREEQFGPVKNATGVDSAESCRKMLQDKDASWLEAAGVAVPRKADGTLDCILELSPAFAVSAEDLKSRASEIEVPVAGSECYIGKR